MTLMRAKMKVDQVESHKQEDKDLPDYESIKFSAVCKSEGYPADGSDENNTFAKWTPCAELQMCITNPALFGKIKAGDQFYLDFTQAEK